MRTCNGKISILFNIDCTVPTSEAVP
jgi:hypothetical protein